MSQEFITINTTEPTAIKIKVEPYSLVEEENSILYEKIPSFNFDSGVDVKEVSDRLKETLKVHRAYGIAAPQCGLQYRIIVIGAEEEYMTMINPEIVSMSEECVVLEEGCLSFPFLGFNISRPKNIIVKFQDQTSKSHELTLSGLTARIVQHEMDHLDGITFHKKAKPLALKSGLKKREKRIKKFAKELVQ